MKFNIKLKDIILGGAIIILLLMLKCTGDNNAKLDAELYLKNYNITVLKDTIKTVKTKNGELVSTKASLVTTIEDLEIYNDTLFDRVNYLEDELEARPVIYINKGVKIVHDTVYVDNYITKLNDSTYVVLFSNDTIYSEGNGRYLSGQVQIVAKDSSIKVQEFRIDKDELFFNAEIVISEKNDTLIASVVSEHPGFKLNNIEPVVLNPEMHPKYNKLNSKKFTVGPYIGLGVGSDLRLSPQIGIGLSYKIIDF